jgi:hypothetical protein
MYFSPDEMAFIQKAASSFLNKKEQTSNEK